MPTGAERFDDKESFTESQYQCHLEILKNELEKSGNVATMDWVELENHLTGLMDSTLAADLLPVLQNTVSDDEKLTVVTRIGEELQSYYPNSLAGVVMDEWRWALLTPQAPLIESEGWGQEYESTEVHQAFPASRADEDQGETHAAAYGAEHATVSGEGTEPVGGQDAGGEDSAPEFSFAVRWVVVEEKDSEDEGF